jgi:hypothetical protein
MKKKGTHIVTITIANHSRQCELWRFVMPKTEVTKVRGRKKMLTYYHQFPFMDTERGLN